MQPLPGVRHHKSPDGVRARSGQANAERMIKLLNDALASEIIGILRHRHQYYMTAGTRSRLVKAQFLEYVGEVQGHADHLVKRIVQLGGRPDVSPEQLMSLTDAAYVEVDSVGRMFAVDLFTERIAIEHYREMIDSLGAEELTTQQVLEMILAPEDARAENLASLVRDCTSEEEIDVTALSGASCVQH